MSILTKQDRCDACSAEARYIVVLQSGGDLILCGHHTDKHREALEARGGIILDPLGDNADATQEVPKSEIDRLTATPGPVRRKFVSGSVLDRTAWYEIGPDLYSVGVTRSDAEDRHKRTGYTATPDSLRRTFPFGYFTEET